MSHHIYSNKHFKIYEVAEGKYVVHNSHKPFEEGHTHINNFDTAKYITRLAVHCIVPKRLSEYLLVSLIRISSDLEYINKLSVLIKEDNFMACKKPKKGSKKPKNLRSKERRGQIV